MQRLSCLVLAATISAVFLVNTPTIAIEHSAAPLTRSEIDSASIGLAEKITPYRARFSRNRPVVAIIGENSGTELSDFVIPYGVLAQSGVAEIVTLATQPGVLKMRPGLQIEAQATITAFDERFPDGADYVIVPAVLKNDDPVLLAWITAQAAKGGTIVSICDGALVVANSGLMKGHRATAHWYTHDLREAKYPDTHWVKNSRYVADGKIISSAGISAAIPTSLALVEAIAGHDSAAALAQQLGVADWSAQHNSDAFEPRFGVNLMAFAAVEYTNGWFHTMQSIGVPVEPGVDEMALALTVDAYSRTGRSRAYSLAVSSAPLLTRHGLIVVPDRIIGAAGTLDRILPRFDATPSLQILDKVLAGIADMYGRPTAYGVALDFEYPGFHQ